MSPCKRSTLVILIVVTLVPACGDDPSGPEPVPRSPSVTFEYEHPFPVGGLYGVWGAASDDIYAVGAYGDVLHYDGTCWASMPTPCGWGLFDVWGISKDDVVAVGDGGLIVHYDGTSWRAEESGTDLRLLGVWGCAPDTFYAVGWSGTLLRFNGSAWDSLGAPTGSDLLRVWGMSGDDFYAGARDALWHYEGGTWTNTGIQVRVRVIGIWGSSANDVWVTDGTNWLWHYDGTAWEDVHTAIMFPFTGLWGFAPDDVFGVGQDGMVSRFGGDNWTLDVVFDGYDLEGLWGADGADLWVCGYNKLGSGGALFHRDGSGWTQAGQSLADGQLRDIWSDASGERAFAVGGDVILQKENGTWTKLPVIPPERLLAVWGAPTGEVFTVGEHGLCFQFDGSSWGDISPGTGQTRFFTDVWGTSGDNVYAAATDGLWRYNGSGWDDPVIADHVRAVWGADESNVFAAGMDTLFHGVVRHFDGDAWGTIYDDSTTWVFSITGAGPRAVLISATDAGGGRGYLFRYNGADWRDVTPPQVSRFESIAGSAQFGFLVKGHNIQGHAIVDQTLLRLVNDSWEILDPRYGTDFRGMWGGLNRGVYLVGRSQIVRCVLN